MKNTMKMIIGIIIATAGVGLAIKSSNPGYISNILINAGCIVIFISLLAMKRKEKKIRDERLVKLSAYSYSYSWLITFVMLGAISWLHEAQVINFTLGSALLTILFTMSISYIVVYLILNHKGDIN